MVLAVVSHDILDEGMHEVGADSRGRVFVEMLPEEWERRKAARNKRWKGWLRTEACRVVGRGALGFAYYSREFDGSLAQLRQIVEGWIKVPGIGPKRREIMGEIVQHRTKKSSEEGGRIA